MRSGRISLVGCDGWSEGIGVLCAVQDEVFQAGDELQIAGVALDLDPDA